MADALEIAARKVARMVSDPSFFEEPHHQSLELLAMKALAQGDVEAAFAFADRRCRVSPAPEAHSFVLRAEASIRMGDPHAAVSDITNALRLAPDDIGANRRMLAWAAGPAQLRAAAALIGGERDFDVLRKAIAVLRRGRRRAIANFTVLDDAIEGWAVWQRKGPLELTIADGVESITRMIEADRSHPLGDLGQAASFQVSRPKSPEPQSIELWAEGQLLCRERAAANMGSPGAVRPRPCAREEADNRVTVIVPVYSDYEATKACLESLLHSLPGAHRAILVDDASPDPRIARYLAEIATWPSVTLLSNVRNLGFVGSVNRALEQVASGDVVFLNADTIVPPGLLDRLAAVARTSPDIGTVMPLSNNGDLCSFPIPYETNNLGTFAEIKSIDEVAAKVNMGAVVDIPNGVGFCLYVTRRCLDSVGVLSEDFRRGYLEDVDFCLRARARGFRNVCAPSIYVGHAGAKSFGSEKRSLVVRNLDVLKTRFPNYRVEFAAFSLADPLRPFREAIERQVPEGSKRPILLLAGPGVLGAIAREHAREHASEEQPVLILEVRRGASGPMVNMIDSAGRMPQSIEFALSSARDLTSFIDYLQELRPLRLDILDPLRMPRAFADLLPKLGIPYDLFIADAGLFSRRTGAFTIAAARLADQSTSTGRAAHAKEAQHGGPVDRWRDLIDGADRILVPCERALAFAQDHLAEHQLCKIGRPAVKRRRSTPRRPPGTLCRLGFLPVRSGAHERWLMGQIARSFKAARPDVILTVIGATLDDSGLMRIGNTFVTGAVEAAELGRVIESYALQCLLVSVARPLFGHALLSLAFNSSLPVAYFDWSRGRFRARRGDLPLDPDASLDSVMSALNRWMLIS
jgi:GT2 family glycosyltransferase